LRTTGVFQHPSHIRLRRREVTQFGPEITDRGARDRLEPLAVSPRQACILLNLGITRLYELIGSGELESYLDGRSRKITTRSIRLRQERLLTAPGATGAAVETRQPRRRGRPRKRFVQEAAT
jgi:hypothetical protein